MGGGKGTYRTATQSGQEAAYTSAAMAQSLWNQTAPYRKGLLQDWTQMRTGTMPLLSQQTFSSLRKPIEAQYDVAKGNILATNPMGGGLFENLGNVETERAGKLSDVMAGIYQDIYNKAYGAAYGAPQTSLGGLQNVMQYGTGAMQAAEAGAQARSSFCCFVFVSADTDEELLEYVRRYKDSHYEMDSNVAQGYKRVALWLVPAMKKYRTIKWIIKWFMVRPMEVYAKAHYEEKRTLEMILYPLAHSYAFLYAIVGCLFGLRGWSEYWNLVNRWNSGRH